MRNSIGCRSFGLAALLLGLAAVSYEASAQQAPQLPLTALQEEGDVQRGKSLAATCAGCHAIDGYRNAYPSFRVPKLGGQTADYLEIALQGYRRGSRAHPTMYAQASSLTDQDIADIVAYIVSLEGEPSAGISRASRAVVDAGRRQVVASVDEEGATATAPQQCASCHGDTGIAQVPSMANLAGQHASYLEHALRQYRAGERQDMVMGPMASTLDDQQIKELVAYFAAQEGLFTPDTM